MSLLNIGATGLMTAQVALNTTSHNIANANTEGYSRQRLETSNATPQQIRNVFFGQGVQIDTIRRMQDEFIDHQIRNNLSGYNNSLIRSDYAERMDNLLADSRTGLAPPLSAFFNAANDVANDPTSSAARTVFLGQADSLVERFHALYDRITEQRSFLNRQIESNVEDINALASNLAQLNHEIVNAYGARDSEPNDLLDKRGVLLNRLAEKVDIQVVEQKDRSISVYIGSGQPLVLSTHASKMSAESLTGDWRNLDIGLIDQNGKGSVVNVTRLISGGELGGLLRTRHEILDPAQNGLGLLAVTLGTEFNRQNQLGLDSNGDLGEAMFEVPEPSVSFYPRNSTREVPTIEFIPGAINQLTNSDYRLAFEDGNFNLYRQDTGALIAANNGGDVIEAHGMRIDISDLDPAEKDQWLIQPTRHAPDMFDLIMTDGAKIATASGALAYPHNTQKALAVGLEASADFDPLTTTPAAVIYDGENFNVYSPTYSDSTNIGPAIIEGFRLVTTDPAAVTEAVVTYNDGAFVVNGESFARDTSGTTTITSNGWELKIRGIPENGETFEVAQVSSTPLETPQPAVTTITGPDWTFDIHGEPTDAFGQPKAGDTWSVNLTVGREGDNRNMLAMAALREKRFVNGNATFEGSYNNIVGEVGTRTRQAQVERDSSQVLLDQSRIQRESLSGVNLDEEAANLLRFQQHYQAAAQTMSVARTIFDTLLSIAR